MAVAHASRVLALLFEANPRLAPDRARVILFGTSVDFGAPGWDATSGAGRLDALEAVKGLFASPAGLGLRFR
jgi:hypothetical protein